MSRPKSKHQIEVESNLQTLVDNELIEGFSNYFRNRRGEVFVKIKPMPTLQEFKLKEKNKCKK